MLPEFLHTVRDVGNVEIAHFRVDLTLCLKASPSMIFSDCNQCYCSEDRIIGFPEKTMHIDSL